MNKNIIKLIISLLIIFTSVYIYQNPKISKETPPSYSLGEIPAYSKDDYVIINDNQPFFTDVDLKRESFEEYSELDYLGRARVAFSLISKDLMPTEKRESIGTIKPSGWHTIKYDFIDGKYLYNRCHLIAYQLTGENKNSQNLITCTRHTNTKKMRQFEDKVAKYINNTNNHVLYRVTPIYEGENLVASGILIEAYSIEDNGKGICFNVYIYNTEDGVDIDYKTGESKKTSD